MQILQCFLLLLLVMPALDARSRGYDLDVEELRLEVADTKHELKSAQVELNLLDERMRKQDEALKSSSGKQGGADVVSLQLKLSQVEKKLSQLDLLTEKLTADVRHLSGRATEVLTKVSELERELTLHDKKFEEVGKLKGTLSSISKAMTQPATPSEKMYRVKAGDSLEKIARQQRISVEALKKYNHLKEDKIIVGQELRLTDESP